MRATVRSVPLLAAAAMAALPAFAQNAPYEPTGEVRFITVGMGAGASFDDDRIVGPAVNLTRREDGTWAGDLGGRDLDLHGSGGKLVGANVSLSYSQKDGRTEVEGLFYGTRIRFSLDAKKFRGRIGACSIDFTRRGGGTYRGDVGCLRAGARLPNTGKARMELLGEAATTTPPLPQLAFALIAILPS